MPQAPKRPCKYPGCNALVTSGHCDAHKGAFDRYRGSSASRGYGSRWQRERAEFLSEHPLCEIRNKCAGIVTPATDVDHKIPRKGDDPRFWDRSNWQASCHACHSSKTRLEDGGFGW